jgi:hypothetical protein
LPGVSYSLQDQKSVPVGRVVATIAPLSFDVPVKLSDDGRLTGPFVRREGTERRFVYIAIGGQAGDGHTLDHPPRQDRRPRNHRRSAGSGPGGKDACRPVAGARQGRSSGLRDGETDRTVARGLNPR